MDILIEFDPEARVGLMTLAGLEDYEKYPAIPWTQVIGMRNRLIHGYDEVDHDIL